MHLNNCLRFPVRLCFAVTSNKAQGQTMKHVGIYLQQDFFSHGQLYVALSRVQSPQNLKIYRPNEGDQKSYETTNVVFKEVLICHCLQCKAMKEKVSIDEVFCNVEKAKIFLKALAAESLEILPIGLFISALKSQIWEPFLQA